MTLRLPSSSPNLTRRIHCSTLLLTLVAAASFASAQQPPESPPQAPSAPAAVPKVPTKSRPQPPSLVAYYASIFAGPTAGVANATQGGGIVGASLGGLVAHRSMRAFTFPGFDMELAAIKPVQPTSTLDGIFSFDLQPAWTNKSQTAAPYLTGGYSRLFVSGNVLNFGTGINLLPKAITNNGYFLRLEARDYWTFASERQHLVTLRVAFCFGLPDD